MRRVRSAMTLVEVVGGLALLATLLVGILLARGRFAHQMRSADRRLAAVAAADRILTAWHQDPRAFPRSGAGSVAGDAQMSWRTQVVPNAPLNDLGAQVVRLDIFDERPQGAAGSDLLTSVETVVAPDPDRAAPATRESTGPKRPTHHAESKRETRLHHP